MMVMFLGALDVTIVTIAATPIAQDLYGFDQLSFLFSSYLLASSISIPIYGKLADLFGRKRILMIGIAIFLVGSFLCGRSGSMLMLIISRAVQGAGSGAIFTLTNTIAGDVFPLEERSKVMAALGTVWGVASLIGPFVGGLLIDILSWHWIFLINVPFCLAAMIMLAVSFQENYTKRYSRFDFGGAIALSVALITLILCISFMDQGAGRDSVGVGFIAGMAALSALSFVVFVLIERRAAEPIIPASINTRTSVYVNIITFIVSIVMIGLGVYLPIYLQNVLFQSATVSGLCILPQSFSWLFMSYILGALLIRFGAKKIIVQMSLILLAGIGLLCFFGVHTPLPVAVLIIFGTGFGMGGVLTGTLLIIQESVSIENRGAAVGVNSLLKSIGEAIGISIFGWLFNTRMLALFSEKGVTNINLGNPHAAAGTNPAVTQELIALVFSDTLFYLFAVMTGLAFISLVVALIFARSRSLTTIAGKTR